MIFTIRRAREGDAGALLGYLTEIAALHREGRPDIFRESFSKYGEGDLPAILADPSRPIFVADAECEGVIGYCFCEVIEYEGHAAFNDHRVLFIDDFFVCGRTRGLGVGGALVSRARELAREVGAAKIELNVWEFNEGAIAFYERCGFRVQRRRMEAEP